MTGMPPSNNTPTSSGYRLPREARTNALATDLPTSTCRKNFAGERACKSPPHEATTQGTISHQVLQLAGNGIAGRTPSLDVILHIGDAERRHHQRTSTSQPFWTHAELSKAIILKNLPRPAIWFHLPRKIVSIIWDLQISFVFGSLVCCNYRSRISLFATLVQKA
jgi:hypothetical protein